MVFKWVNFGMHVECVYGQNILLITWKTKRSNEYQLAQHDKYSYIIIDFSKAASTTTQEREAKIRD
jgi:hypothetical protein